MYRSAVRVMGSMGPPLEMLLAKESFDLPEEDMSVVYSSIKVDDIPGWWGGRELVVVMKISQESQSGGACETAHEIDESRKAGELHWPRCFVFVRDPRTPTVALSFTHLDITSSQEHFAAAADVLYTLRRQKFVLGFPV